MFLHRTSSRVFTAAVYGTLVDGITRTYPIKT
jgi:hypothetical protein